MAENETLRRGRELRRELMGDRLVETMASTVYDGPVMRKFGDYAGEAVFGLPAVREAMIVAGEVFAEITAEG